MKKGKEVIGNYTDNKFKIKIKLRENHIKVINRNQQEKNFLPHQNQINNNFVTIIIRKAHILFANPNSNLVNFLTAQQINLTLRLSPRSQ